MATLPRVSVFSMGGTIASSADHAGRAQSRLAAQDLIAAVPQLKEVAELSVTSFRQVPSGELTIQDLVALVNEVRRRVARGDAGAVVTQGTDTLEETSFVLDLLWDRDDPIVVTGAMRHPGLPGAHGPANLLGAVQVARSDGAGGLGCIVVMNDEIHAARFVRKTHTSNPATFHSPGTGPMVGSPRGNLRTPRRCGNGNGMQFRIPVKEEGSARPRPITQHDQVPEIPRRCVYRFGADFRCSADRTRTAAA